MNTHKSNSLLAKPVAFECMSYPYFQLSAYEFEELIYEISCQEFDLGKGELARSFDSAGWPNISGDRGRDILLFKEGNSTGVIQCKHSKNNTKKFSKIECSKEIIKFVLHCSIDSSLVHNINSFTYYFAVSSGFSEDAILFLENFGNNIIKELEIENWIETVVNKYQKLKTTFDGNYGRILNNLSKLRVRRIDSTKIDGWLNQDYNQNIIGKYFKVKEIYLPNTNILISDIPIGVIQKNIKAASHFLFDYNNFFFGFPDSHIERQETSQLLNWSKEELNDKEEPLAVLVGSPGNGKSVVLKDLLVKLDIEKIPFIGIKADRYYSNNKESLEKELGLCDSFEKLIKALVEKHDKVVVVIDQLDALSQSLSAKREYINTYQTLIHQLLIIDKVRIIASIRKFDLETDSDFTFLRKYRTFHLSKLSKDEANIVLEKLIPKPVLNESTYKLLESPFNLNAFVKIYSSSLNINNLKSTEDLYKELWRQKIVQLNQEAIVNYNNLKNLLYSVAVKMHEMQMIEIPLDTHFEEYHAEINYLCKEGVLTLSNSSVQFFHQTFYDFVFAKQFCESGESILKFTQSRWQSIGIRSMVKMVFGFLRETNHDEYQKMLSEFIFSKRIRFHFKLLLFQILASEQNPTKEEITFVRDHILRSQKYRDIFIEAINSTEWLQFIISENLIIDLENTTQGLIDKIISKAGIKIDNTVLQKIGYDSYPRKVENNSNLWRSLFLRMLPKGRDIVLDYIDKTAFSNKSDFTRRCLYFLSIWDNPIAFKLYDKYSYTLDKRGFDTYKMMEDASMYNIDWVITKFKKSLIEKISALKHGVLEITIDINHSDSDLFKKLYKQDCTTIFYLNLEVLLLLIEKSKYNEPYRTDNLIIDNAFHHTKFGEEEGYKFLFHQFGEEIQLLAKKSSSVFDDFINEHLNSNYETIIRLVIYGLIANPQKYIDRIFALFISLYQRGLLKDDYSWHYYLRKLLGTSYSYFSQKQCERINGILLTLKYPKEYHINKNSESGKKTRHTYFNQLLYKYLKSIPENLLYPHKEINRKYQECKRRYNDIDDNEPHNNEAHFIGPPLGTNAYENMSLLQWKKSFFRYVNDEQRDFDSFKGGVTEHARAFEAEVKKRPEYFVKFIEELIDDKKIEITYIIHGLNGLKEVKYNLETVRTIFLKVIKKRDIPDSIITYFIWIVDCFIENEYMDKEILDFIIQTALHKKSPSQIYNPSHLISDGINSIRGSAVEKLIRVTYKPIYADRIFRTVEKVSEDKMDSIKAAVLYRLAHLNHYDQRRSFEIFKSLVETDNEELLKVSFWSAGYLKQNFYHEMMPYFRKLMAYDSLHKDTAVLLTVAWLEEVGDSKELLDELNRKSVEARATVVHVAGVNFFHKNSTIHDKCIKLFCSFLNDDSKEVADKYSHLFLRLLPDKFESILPALTRYSKSIVCENNPNYFIEYLFKCTRKYPIACLDLFENMDIIHNSDNEKYRYINDKVLNVIVGSYNALLKEKDKNKRQIIRSVKLFDKYLKDSRFRLAAEKVLEINDN